MLDADQPKRCMMVVNSTPFRAMLIAVVALKR